MENADLDRLRLNYKEAVNRWVAAIRAEENLATPDHSEIAVEAWDQANFTEQDARSVAKTARQEYADALRQVLFNF
jgi:Tfp pilus assembly protein PilN